MTERTLATALGSVLLLVTAATASAGIKCWTNNEGVRECGNVVPPEYIRQGHEEITHSGAAVTRHEGALSPEELAAQRQAAAEEQRRQRLMEQQRVRDMVLLQTYTSERELDLAVADKIAVIDASVRLAGERLEKLRATLEQLRSQAANQETRSATGVSDKTRRDIERVEQQIIEHEEYIAKQKAERDALETRHREDRQRFNLLKSNAIRPGDISHIEAPDNGADGTGRDGGM